MSGQKLEDIRLYTDRLQAGGGIWGLIFSCSGLKTYYSSQKCSWMLVKRILNINKTIFIIRKAEVGPFFHLLPLFLFCIKTFSVAQDDFLKNRSIIADAKTCFSINIRTFIQNMACVNVKAFFPLGYYSSPYWIVSHPLRRKACLLKQFCCHRPVRLHSDPHIWFKWTRVHFPQ